MTKENNEPVIPAHVKLPEITFRAVILGIILTIILAAANAFLGLKVGVTVSASIPAAVISMGILRFFKNSNVLENNMVQLMASVGEALTSGIAFILPALIILHVWDGFNYWQTAITSLLGGLLGVLFTIPLRRALLHDKTLRYPEGVAIGNILKASMSKEKGDLQALTVGGLVGGVISLFQSGFQILSDNFQYWIKGNTTIFGFGLGFSPALIAAGYIVGINVALSVLLGVVLGWICGIPLVGWYYGLPAVDSTSQMAISLWREYTRYVGVGTMLVGGLWTMCTLLKPITKSMVTSFATLRSINLGQQPKMLRTEQDIPIHYVIMGALLLLIPIFMLIAFAVIPSNIGISAGFRYLLSGTSAIYILMGGFVFCSVAAYFAGLVGSTNSPISGMLVSALLILCLIFIALFSTQSSLGNVDIRETLGVVAAIGSMVVVGAALSIANDTMQDLKVGDIVGATPWKQQAMLMFGVVVASFVLPPILQLLYNAYGIGGVFPRPNMNPAQMLAAPQAGMMAAVAKGAFSHNLNWALLGIGAIVAIICIIIDEYFKKTSLYRLPVLAVGVGIYLPLDSSVPVIIGGFLSYFVQARLNQIYNRKDPSVEDKINKSRHLGLLLCCGIVAGASLMGVLLAIPFAIKQSSDALKIMPEQFSSFSGILSILVTVILCAWIYRSVLKAKKVS